MGAGLYIKEINYGKSLGGAMAGLGRQKEPSDCNRGSILMKERGGKEMGWNALDHTEWGGVNRGQKVPTS